MKILGSIVFAFIILIWYFYISYLSSIWNSPIWTAGGIIGVVLSIIFFIILIGISVFLEFIVLIMMVDLNDRRN